MLSGTSRRPAGPAILPVFGVLIVVCALWSPVPAANRRAGASGAVVAVPACGPNAQDTGVLPSALPVRQGPGQPAPPPLTARAAAVIDAETGRLLYGLDEHRRRSPASTTKIMTAILAIEHRPLDDLIIAESDAVLMSAAGSSVMGLMPGTQISMRDLLYGLMLPSGNDAALDIARAVDGSVPAFVERMNAKAAELRLVDTAFRNPHGLSGKGHYSSAYDLAMLTRYAMANQEFRRIVATPSYHLAPPSDYDLHNGNSLLATYPGADGVKIGWTERARWTFVASAVHGGRRVIVALLKSDDRDADAAALFDWAFSSHRWVAIGPQTVGMMDAFGKFGLGQSLRRVLTVCG